MRVSAQAMLSGPGLQLGQFDGGAGLDLVQDPFQAGIVSGLALFADGARQAIQRGVGDVAVDQGDPNLAQNVENIVGATDRALAALQRTAAVS